MYYFDETVEESIKQCEKEIAELKAKKPDRVFHCPKCKQDFRYVLNYREMGMCGKCLVKKQKEDYEERIKILVGGVITKVEASEPSPYGNNKVGIIQIKVRLPNGKIVEAMRKNEPILLL